MEKLEAIFQKYKENYDKWNELILSLYQKMVKEEWLDLLRKNNQELYAIYSMNGELISKINKMLEDSYILSEEELNAFYEIGMKLYFADYDDPQLLINIFNKLLPYYEEKNDISKLVDLYSACRYYVMELENSRCAKGNMLTYYIRKIFELKKYYLQMDELTRYRLLISYYTYIVYYMDCGCISLKDALKVYFEMIEFAESEEALEQTKDETKVQGILNYIKKSICVGIIRIDEADKETWKIFYDYIVNHFKTSNLDRKSDFELTAEEYACYLYLQYYNGKLNKKEIYERYYEYFEHKFKVIKACNKIEYEEVLECINCIRVIAKLAKLSKDQERINCTKDLLMNIVEAKWLRGNIQFTETIDEMLCEICMAFMNFGLSETQNEKCIVQLIIQRNLEVYCHSKITAEIAIAIYREMIKKKPEFFDSVTKFSKEKWKDLLYNGALFHDIGKTKILGVSFQTKRPKYEIEQDISKRSIEYGARVFEKFPQMSYYADFVKGIYVNADGSNELEYDFARADSQVLPFIDILRVAHYIEKTTNMYLNFDSELKPIDEVLKTLVKNKGTLYSDKVVETIQNSVSLRNECKNMVKSRREEILYDNFHNWEKIQLAQDDQSIIDEIEKHYQIFAKEEDMEAFMPYYKKAVALAKDSKNDLIKAQALFEIERYLFFERKYELALMKEKEISDLLIKTKQPILLAKHYVNVANTEYILNHNENALSYYLKCIQVSEHNTECIQEMNIANISIANIFLNSSNYNKAIEYYSKIHFFDMPVNEKIEILCQKAYCFGRVNEYAKMKQCRQEIYQLLDENNDFADFVVYVYLAYIAYLLDEKDQFRKFMKIVEDNNIEGYYLYCYIDEIFLYLELLEKIDQELYIANLDKYIKYCENDNELNSFCSKLLRKRLLLMAKKTDAEEFAFYEEMVKNTQQKELEEKAKHMEDMEKTYIELMQLNVEQSEIIENQKELEESVKKANSANQQKSLFLSNMSHEIRTPINAILGLNEMILRESQDEQIIQYASDIENAGKQLLGIVNDVLDFSKIEAGKLEMVSIPFKMNEVIRDIQRMVEPKTREKNLKFKVKYNEEIPNGLFGDSLRIKQILLNILSNAYKYTKEGYVEFSVEYEKIDDKTVAVCFTVTDTGIGLSEDQINKLAVPFERFEHQENYGVEGTGLGMSIVTKLLGMMNSKLEIASEVSEGSTFSFTLVLEVYEWTSIGKNDTKYSKSINAVREFERKTKKLVAPKAKILVVDDNMVNLKVMKALLKRTQMQVTLVSSGKECLELCKTEEYHIILLDHMMPEMDGIETVQYIRKSDGINKDTIIVALTANVVDIGDDYYESQGFDALLTKPVDIQYMEELLLKLLPEYLIEK